MKLNNKIMIAFDIAFICMVLLQFVIITLVSSIRNETENEIRYEIVERFGDIDTDGTLFIAADGNMYAVDAQYPTIKGNRFLLRLDGKGTESKTDDEILEVWAAPEGQTRN